MDVKAARCRLDPAGPYTADLLVARMNTCEWWVVRDDEDARVVLTAMVTRKAGTHKSDDDADVDTRVRCTRSTMSVNLPNPL